MCYYVLYYISLVIRYGPVEYLSPEFFQCITVYMPDVILCVVHLYGYNIELLIFHVSFEEELNEHAKNAEACIDEVDVCIFVTSYANHLTNDEVNFLQKIHHAFKEKNKFYSLFITVNQIDLRYNDTEEKSVDRIIDYIRQRLADLPTPYKNITIFGTSA